MYMRSNQVSFTQLKTSIYISVKNGLKGAAVLVDCCSLSQGRLETFLSRLLYYMLGQTIPKDDGGREEAVLIDALLNW